MLMDSLVPSGPARVVDELGVPGPEVLRLCVSPGGGSSAVGLIERPVESLDGSDSDDSLCDFGDQDEGVSDLDLREDPGSSLSYLRARRERVVKGRFRSMPGLPLRMEFRLHNLLIFQLDRELTCHRSRVSDVEDRLSRRIRRSGS